MPTPTLTPPGWKLVPVEATPEMLVALLSPGESAAASGIDQCHLGRLLELAGAPERYRAMVEAAPEAPEQAAQPATTDARNDSLAFRYIDQQIAREMDRMRVALAADTTAQPADVARLVEAIDRRFRSSNGVAVERAVVPAAEWYPLCAALAAKGGA